LGSKPQRGRLRYSDDTLDEDDDLDPDFDLDLDAPLDGYDDDDIGGLVRPARSKPARPAKARPRATERRRARDTSDEFDDWEPDLDRGHDRKRVAVSEPFKCRNCRAFIGEPPTGGRNRNHCPLCLHSLHVDDKTPGDRASTCRSLMAPIGVFYRRNGEQVVVHRCLGCGFVRYNRIAADDNPAVLDRLPVVDPLELHAAASDESER
jgi:hypothetical protein